MSWTIKRNAEQEERSNEKANGENDPGMNFNSV